ncbi:beta-lactamase/transpeptidase-like protein [Kockovaella imperatae]|uniref:Beta-lactamase/transpeptidase-like protein n=1 Tax=Kockovaella imperatae TaxID=4999 RepID=A0A1Y1UM19_9TREE|nr:beta-lactamase/transpeptidase-like protein [Kockovaella imperatae]ORX38534.1 beta-lactamase/transpeptidase-like protein [Kockovaella imperatae]
MATVSLETLNWIESIRSKYGVPGLSFGVVKGISSKDETGSSLSSNARWEHSIHGFGTRNVQGDPYNEQTVCAIGSCSKVFSYLVVALLIHDGTKLPNGEPLKWETRVKDALGDAWEMKDQYATEHCTLHDLSGMKIGLGPHPYGRTHTTAESYDDQLRLIRHLTMSAELRQRFQYDSICPLALAGIAELITGKPYHTLVEEMIFEPLGMQSSFCDNKKARDTHKISEGFFRRGGSPQKSGVEKTGEPVSVGWWTKDEGYWMVPMGGIASTAKDMLLFLQELMEAKHLSAGILETPAEGQGVLWGPYNAMLKLDQNTPGLYGRGQAITSYRGHPVEWHSGNMPGQIATMIRIPGQKLGLFIGVNDGTRTGAALMFATRNRILDELLGLGITGREDYESKFLTPVWQPAPPISPPLPSEESARQALKELYPGTYAHGAYKTWQPYPFDPKVPESQAMIDAARLAGHTHEFDTHCIVSKSTSFWLSHILFRPLVNPVNGICTFDWFAFQVYPVSNGKEGWKDDEFVASVRSKGRGVWSEKGIGMFEGFWDIIPSSQKPLPTDWHNGVDKEASAEVWMRKES